MADSITADWLDSDLLTLADMAIELGTNANWLLDVMSYESGDSPGARNKSKYSSATGLIQFMGPWPSKWFPFTRDEFASLSVARQLPFVRRHFLDKKGKLTSLTRVYQAVLYPASLYYVSADTDVIFGNSDEANALGIKFGLRPADMIRAYNANSGLDANRDGKVTPWDLAQALTSAARRPRYLELVDRLARLMAQPVCVANDDDTPPEAA